MVADFSAIELVDRDVGFPASCTTGEVVTDVHETHSLNDDVRNVSHRQGVVRANVENVVADGLVSLHELEGRHYIINVDIWLSLLAIPEDLESRRVLGEPSYEIIRHAVCLVRTDDIGETENRTRNLEHVTVSADH